VSDIFFYSGGELCGFLASCLIKQKNMKTKNIKINRNIKTVCFVIIAISSLVFSISYAFSSWVGYHQYRYSKDYWRKEVMRHIDKSLRAKILEAIKSGENVSGLIEGIDD